MSSGSSAMLREVIQKLILSAIILISFSILISAQPSDYFTTRWKVPSTVVAMQGPYTWADTVNCASGAYTVDSNYVVCEMRTVDSCVISCKLRSKDNVVIRASAGDIFRLDLLKVYKTGTDSLVRFGGKISIFGLHK